MSESKWFKGPEFLWQYEVPETLKEQLDVNPDDPELKRGQCFVTETKPVLYGSLLERLQYFSDWHRAKKAIAVCLRFIDKLRSHSVKKPAQVHSLQFLRVHFLPHYRPVTVIELQRAEIEIIKVEQAENFKISSKKSKLLDLTRSLEFPPVEMNSLHVIRH